MKRTLELIILILFGAGFILSTETGSFTFKKGNVEATCWMLMGREAFYPDEVMDCAHKLRLTKSLADKFGIRKRVNLVLHPDDASAFVAYTMIEYKKKFSDLPYPVDDFSFVKALLGLFGRRERADKILKNITDWGTPSISSQGDRMAILLWKEGRQVISLRNRKNEEIWRWSADPIKQIIATEPVLSPDGKRLYFIVRERICSLGRIELLPPSHNDIYIPEKKEKKLYMLYKWGLKLYIKDFKTGRFSKQPLPSSLEDPTSFLFPSAELLIMPVFSWLENRKIELLFFKGGKLFFRSLLKPEIFQGWPSAYILSLSPGGKYLLVMPREEVSRNETDIRYCMSRVFLIDVRNKKIREFPLLPAHYSFLWDGERRVYLATKGKRKGEIFYLDFAHKKSKKLYLCREPLEAFLALHQKTLLFKKGSNKLLVYKGGKFSTQTASFYHFYFNQAVYDTFQLFGSQIGENKIGAFRSKSITVLVSPNFPTKVSSQTSFDYWTGEAGIREIKKVILSPGSFNQLREALRKYSPVSLDIQEKEGFFLLHSPNGGRAELIHISFERKEEKGWDNSMLFNKEIWKSMNDAIIDVDKSGLRVEIAPERNWGLAYFSNLRLTNDINAVQVEVADLSPKGRWIMKLRGDLLGDGRDLTLHLLTSSKPGIERVNIDPRFPIHWKSPIEIQLGLEGEPGAYAIFKSVEFIKGEIKQGKGSGIEAINLMPDLPHPYKMLDWRSLAREYINFVFDFNKKGEFLPLIWIDDTDKDNPAFGLQSYVGTGQKGREHEAVTTLSALLTASLVGIDKLEFVPMAKAYYSPELGLVLNGKGMKNSSGDWWYDIWPSVLFYMLVDRYPQLDEEGKIVKSIADRWYDVCLRLKGEREFPDFNHTAYDFLQQKPIDRGWAEPDSSAGIAWLEYLAWLKFKDERYLQAVDWCLRYLESLSKNPYYEVLLPWGAYISARANGELGRDYDVGKLLNWCFGMSDYRWGWGTILGNWGGYDCYGLVGSVGGYAFAMNTFAQAGALAPIPRYDSRYAYAIAKYLLNVANSARLYFPSELPKENQSSYFWVEKVGGKVPIAYEALRQNWEGKSPYGTGDALRSGWAKTDLGLYGSGHIGLLASIIEKTNVEGIVMFDCLATDFFHSPAYPTYLVFNPYSEKKEIVLDLGEEFKDIYDAVSHRFIKKGLKGKAGIILSPKSAYVFVIAPSNGKLKREGKKLLLNDVVIDYNLKN